MRRLPALLVAVGCLVLTSGIQAHPTSSAFVVVRVPGDGVVTVDFSTDAKTLALTLQGLTGRTDRIDEQAADVLQFVDLQADGRKVALGWSGVEDTPGRPGLVTLHFSGTIAPGARTLQWRSALVLTAYPLAVVRDTSDLTVDDYEWIAGQETSDEHRLDQLGTPGSLLASAVRLVPQGFTHILPGGLDHVLFMLGLSLVASTRRAIVVQVSLFTLAHSLTLAIAVLGLVSVPARIVEPLIAASIAFVALENLIARPVSYGRYLAVFGFGLLHGLGFAGAMAGLGLSGEHLAGALVGFNVGVELGQLAVIGGAALIVTSLRLTIDVERRFVVRPVCAAIALTGLFWTIERIWSAAGHPN